MERGCPSQVKGAGLRSLWRRPAWVQGCARLKIPPPASTESYRLLSSLTGHPHVGSIADSARQPYDLLGEQPEASHIKTSGARRIYDKVVVVIAEPNLA